MKIFYLLLCILFSCLLVLCSKDSTKPEMVTFSGTVTLEGKTDYNGVTVSLYQPVVLDTALVRINQQYPNIGVQISQETEFDHREHSPLYSTNTDASGHWKIEEVTPGTYNVVAEKDSFGWRYRYNSEGGQNNFDLKKAFYLKGQYNSVFSIPGNSFINISGNVLFSNNSQLNIGAGTVIEFENNSNLEIYGQLDCSGDNNNPILFSSKSQSDSWKFRLMQSSVLNMDFCYFFSVPNGIYFSSIDSASVDHCRFQDGLYAIEIFDCPKFLIQNSLVSDMEDGIKTSNSHSSIFRNVIINIADNAITSLNEMNSTWEYNLIKNCGNIGIALNPAGYAYTDTWIKLFYNDFINNKDHLVLGQYGWCMANYNNFINESNYIVYTSAIIDIDTLNFRNNYWNYITPLEIDQKIYDLNDMSGIPNVGCIVDYRDFSNIYIEWI